jgi:PAS domain S-box-containing protein
MPRVSIYIRILVFFSLLVFIPVLVTSYVNYRSEKGAIEKEYSRQLEDLVNRVAPKLDGDLINTIRRGDEGEIEGRVAFDDALGIFLQTLELRGLSRGENPLYVFRKAEDFGSSGMLEYVVMTSLNRRGNYYVGLRYPPRPEQMQGLAGDSSVTGIYSDGGGTWISAIAPIYDSKQAVVAIVQANFPVEYLYQQLRANTWQGLRIALFSLLLCGLPALLFARSIVRPIRALVEATKRFANNELEYRVRSRRRDELGDLAKSFDWMAEQLLVDRLKRVETEASLRNSEAESQKLALVASLTHNSVVIMDYEGRIEWGNDSFQRITGYALEDAEGRRLLDLLEGEKTDADGAKAIRDEFDDGKGFNKELIFHRKDGEPFWCALEIQPVRNSGGAIVNYVAIQSDITERKRAAEELGKAKDSAESANKAKSEFLAVMSHEIRTPMNGILGFANLLRETRLNTQQRDYTETIQTSGEALLSLLNDILDFSKIESGHMEMEKISFELRQCVEDALDLIASQAARKKLEVVARFDPGLPDWFIGDVTRVRQIIVNLCGNAVKFTEQGEITVSVGGAKTGSDVDGDAEWELHIRVKDTGVGIPEERRERLFKAFSQVDSSVTRKYGGTGLGLVICKRLAEIMGGRIWVESEAGEGSEFQFTVKVPAESKQKPLPWDLQRDKAQDASILVVDDNRTALDQLAACLRTWGMKAHAVATLEEGDVRLSGEKIDAVLLDGSFADDAGAAFGKRVAEAGGKDGLPLVVMSAMGSEDQARKVLGDGIHAVISKPVHQSALFYCLIEIVAEGETDTVTTMMGRSMLDASLGDRIPLKILLAEDNPTNQKLAVLTLRQMGYRCDIANHGLEALEAIQREAYDLVLMDIQMPEMDGLEATRQIRAYEGDVHGKDGHRTRIVAMTANATVADKEKCLEVGMDDYVSKPVRPDALQRALVKGQPTMTAGEEDGEVRRGQTIAAAETAIKELCEALEPEGVIEMAESFMQDVPQMISDLNRTAGEGSLEELERAAHSLKGAAGIFNWQGLVARARKVEELAEAGELAKAKAGISDIEEEFDVAHGALERAVLRLKETLEG